MRIDRLGGMEQKVIRWNGSNDMKCVCDPKS